MYNLNSEKFFKISDSVKTTFDKYQQRLPAKEVGGIILGKILKNDCIVVEFITKPSCFDFASLFGFTRNKKQAQRQINKYWKESNGETIYLGEWHSHNEEYPVPSFQDRNTMKDLLITSKLEIDALFMIIIGMKDNYIGIQTKDGLRKLKKIDDNCYLL